MNSDRRKYRRVSVNLEAKFFGGAESGSARIPDISVSGCYIETLIYVAVGSILTIEVKMPTGNWLSLKGEVMYCHPNMGFGFNFVELSQSKIDVLNSLIEYEIAE